MELAIILEHFVALLIGFILATAILFKDKVKQLFCKHDWDRITKVRIPHSVQNEHKGFKKELRKNLIDNCVICTKCQKLKGGEK